MVYEHTTFNTVRLRNLNLHKTKITVPTSHAGRTWRGRVDLAHGRIASGLRGLTFGRDTRISPIMPPQPRRTPKPWPASSYCTRHLSCLTSSSFVGAVEAVLLRVLDFDDAHGNGVCLPQQAMPKGVALAL